MNRPAWLLALALVLAAPCLATAEPSPPNSTTPSCISLVGSSGGVAAAAGQFTVVIRDLANNPIPGARVTIDVSGHPDLHLCADQLDAAMSVDCVHGTVSKLTDAAGSVQFTLLGGSNGAGGAVTLLGGGRIYWEGTLIAFPTVSAFDLDGSSGVGANDLSAWLTDFGSGNDYGRCDYDCSGGVGANDLSLWLTVFGSGEMAESCGTNCP